MKKVLYFLLWIFIVGPAQAENLLMLSASPLSLDPTQSSILGGFSVSSAGTYSPQMGFGRTWGTSTCFIYNSIIFTNTTFPHAGTWYLDGNGLMAYAATESISPTNITCINLVDANHRGLVTILLNYSNSSFTRTSPSGSAPVQALT